MINKNKKKRIIIIIPARLKSKRLEKKLLRRVNGLPMIIRVAKSAEELELGRVIVGTDSFEIFKLCEKNNVESMMTKTEHKSGTDRINEVYSNIKDEFDLIVNLQGDLPVFTKELFEKTIKLFLDDSVDIGSAVCDLKDAEILDRDIVKAEVHLDKRNSGFAKDFTRTPFKQNNNLYHHIGIYIYRPKILEKFVKLSQSINEKERNLEQMRAMDNSLKIKLTKVSHNPPSVDTIEDLEKIRLHFKKNDF